MRYEHDTGLPADPGAGRRRRPHLQRLGPELYRARGTTRRRGHKDRHAPLPQLCRSGDTADHAGDVSGHQPCDRRTGDGDAVSAGAAAARVFADRRVLRAAAGRHAAAAPAYFCPCVRGLVAAAGVSVLIGPSEQRPARRPGRRADARPARVRDARDGAAGRLGGRGDRGVCVEDHLPPALPPPRAERRRRCHGRADARRLAGGAGARLARGDEVDARPRAAAHDAAVDRPVSEDHLRRPARAQLHPGGAFAHPAP